MGNDYSLKAEQACSFLQTYREEPFIRHEWEELLEKLFDSGDPELRGIGIRESAAAQTGISRHKLP